MSINLNLFDIGSLYRKYVPFDVRHRLYVLRHIEGFKQLRHKDMYPSNLGTHSLRGADSLKCIFIHIPKAAGTSISKSLFKDLTDHHTAFEYQIIFGKRDFNSYYKFAFVRNPWARLFSAYHYLKSGGWGWYEKQRAQDAFGRYDAFNDFVISWLNRETLNTFVHFWPQSRFVSDLRGRLCVNEIFYFENIEGDFAKLCNRLKIKSTLHRVNVTNAKHDYRANYTPEAIKKVAELYQKDVEMFKYNFET
jgi:hypothetical protein